MSTVQRMAELEAEVLRLRKRVRVLSAALTGLTLQSLETKESA
jgi:hypothetical protein